MTSPTLTSLFCGAGGLDLGFTKAGFEVTAAYDSDAGAVKCYNANHKHKCIQTNLADESVDIKRSKILIAGPPCQGFSTAGGYKKDDDRNHLLLSTCRMAVSLRPEVVVIENVAALANRKNRDFLSTAIAILREAGYFVDYSCFSAEQFGVAQRRKRLFLIARSRNRPFDIRKIESMGQKRTVREALSGLDSMHSSHEPVELDKSAKCAKIIRRIKPGQKLCNVRRGESSVHTWDIPEVFGVTTKSERETLEAIQRLRRTERRRSFGDADPVSRDRLAYDLKRNSDDDVTALISKRYLRTKGEFVDLTNTFNGKYRRLSWDHASPTVDTRFGDIQLFVHPSEDRAMTVREAARLQGFPDTFTFPSFKRTSFRLIGNAVPPPMAHSLGLLTRELI